MIDTASLFKQRRRSIGCGAGSRPAEAGERGLKVAPRGRAASPPARARSRRQRRPEIGWSRDCRRCAAASKPAPAGLGEIKNETNKLAKRPGSRGGAGGAGGAGAAGPRVQVPARRCLARPLLAGGWGTEGQDPVISKVVGGRFTPWWRSCFPRGRRAWGVRAVEGGRRLWKLCPPSWALAGGPSPLAVLGGRVACSEGLGAPPPGCLSWG